MNEMTFDLLLLPGFFASGVTVTMDVLAVATRIGHEFGVSGFRARILSPDGKSIESESGPTFSADGSWRDARADVTIPFGTGLADAHRAVLGVESELAARLVTLLGQRHADGGILAASCSSTFLLAETGLLNGGAATTSWWLSPLFAERYPHVHLDAGAMVTSHERIFCAGAAMAHLDLMLHLVRRYRGMEFARACARYLIIEDERASQARFLIADHLARHDPDVSKAQAWIRARLSEGVRISEVAKHAGMSERTLERRFKEATGMTPRQYLLRARAEAAARLLETTNRSVAQVADLVGYAQEGALRRAFRRHFGMSPSAYRRRRG